MYAFLAGVVIVFEIIHYVKHNRIFLFSYAVLCSVAVVFIVKTFFVQFFLVPTNSMFPTINEGDLTISVPFKQGDKLFRGDVIVFQSPAFPSFMYVKRIIGIAGDIIEYKSDKSFFINGRAQGTLIAPSPYKVYTLYAGIEERNGNRYQYVTDNTKPYVKPIYSKWVVPDGYVFVVGDNRDDSWDSRYWENPIGTPKKLRGLLPINKVNSLYKTTVLNFPLAKDSFDFGHLGLKVISDNQIEKSQP